jgi:hypothetical protein
MVVEKTEKIEKLETENKKFIEVKTEKEILQGDLQKTKQELLDVKVEHNKLKMMYNKEILEEYEKSLRIANENLKEAREQMEKNEDSHREQLLEVFDCLTFRDPKKSSRNSSSKWVKSKKSSPKRISSSLKLQGRSRSARN